MVSRFVYASRANVPDYLIRAAAPTASWPTPWAAPGWW